MDMPILTLVFVRNFVKLEGIPGFEDYSLVVCIS